LGCDEDDLCEDEGDESGPDSDKPDQGRGPAAAEPKTNPVDTPAGRGAEFKSDGDEEASSSANTSSDEEDIPANGTNAPKDDWPIDPARDVDSLEICDDVTDKLSVALKPASPVARASSVVND
jgi:hypothetical protein